MKEAVEHALKLPSGAMQVRAEGLEEVYPLADWIEHRRAEGDRVFRRRILILEDWEEVTDGE